ncbi:DUF2004 domain-containing protein [Pseudaestuariivita rosea]|uniref:DUF2004 domain-containing protein n=1 Tax=Pseudaestuariivita rosea TaxID=2763263 RepID=UPI001ABA4795|nr:DUF2004 domain-containing protein [Pseudaestuariivita rosea]
MKDQIAKQEAARAKIRALYGTPEGEDGPTLFVSHHLDELSSDEWKQCLAIEKPTAEQILDGLVLVSAWDSKEDGNIDTFDFSLPNNMTNYLIAVRFDGDEIESVDMES